MARVAGEKASRRSSELTHHHGQLGLVPKPARQGVDVGPDAGIERAERFVEEEEAARPEGVAADVDRPGELEILLRCGKRGGGQCAEQGEADDKAASRKSVSSACPIPSMQGLKTRKSPIPWLPRSPGLLSRRASGRMSAPPEAALGPDTRARHVGTLAANSAKPLQGLCHRRRQEPASAGKTSAAHKVEHVLSRPVALR